MHDLSNVITALGTLIGALTLILKAWTSNSDDTVKHLEDVIKQKDCDIELYRTRWLKVERENELLKKELNK